jgi:single-strand DNA-binding protein
VSRSLNKVTLIGNLGNDPEIRTTNNGSKVANFSLATTRQWNSASGEKQEKTEWHKCIAWNTGGKGTGLADIIERYVHKGDKLYVEGRIEYRQFEDKEKQTRYVTEINVREILLLGGKGGGGGSGGGDSFEGPAARSRPADKTKKAGGDFEEFPGALDQEDDDLPF